MPQQENCCHTSRPVVNTVRKFGPLPRLLCHHPYRGEDVGNGSPSPSSLCPAPSSYQPSRKSAPPPTRDETHYAAHLLRAGARGCISKTEPTHKIIAALRSVLQGRRYLSPATISRLVAQPSLVAVGPPSIGTLSDRELEVFAMTG